MKNIYLLVLLISSITLFGQSRIVSQKVQQLNSISKRAVEFDLFTKNNDLKKSSKYSKAASDITVLELNERELKRIVDDAPEFISLEIPYQNQLVEVQLYQQNIFMESFVAKDEKGNIIDYKPGKYYRGIVNGDYTSIAAISFFEDNVIGVVSTYELGNLVLGKSTDKKDYVSYSDRNLLMQNSFECQIDESNRNYKDLPVFDPSMLAKTETENCVKIHYELTHSAYLGNGSDLTATLDWITGIQNLVATLYNNDGVNVALQSIGIWTVSDPYSEVSPNLNDLVSATDADIVNLITIPKSTSGAPLDSLCSDSSWTSSHVDIAYENFPTYSWTITAITHEMGHTMGSPHTQDCFWNGDNTAIDECGWLGGENCGNPGYPENGGTIMSYCHWIEDVGINLNEGFGPQPAALIRSTVDSKDCLDFNCSDNYSNCEFTIQDLTTIQPSSGIIEIRITDEVAHEWLYQIVPFGEPLTDNWELTTLPVFTINESELNQNEYYRVVVKNSCVENVGGGSWSSLILVGDFCDGTLFTDTGGQTGSAKQNQHIIKTFFPSHTAEKVQIDFHRYITVNSIDYIYVYDGNSTASPLFEGGILTGYNTSLTSFTSTDSSGAITVEFISQALGISQGWETTVHCAVMSTEETDQFSQINIYPNPATTSLNVESEKEIKSIKLHDMSGKLVLNQNINSLKSVNLNIKHLQLGTYMVTVNFKNKKIIKKLLKL